MRRTFHALSVPLRVPVCAQKLADVCKIGEISMLQASALFVFLVQMLFPRVGYEEFVPARDALHLVSRLFESRVFAFCQNSAAKCRLLK